MIVPKTDSDTPVCVNCAHHSDAFEISRCALFISSVNGQDALCCEVRADENKCGAAGKLFERRYNTKAYVEDAPIYTYRTADGKHHTKTLTGEPPSLGQMYEEDDPGIQQRIVDQKLKPFTDYKPAKDNE